MKAVDLKRFSKPLTVSSALLFTAGFGYFLFWLLPVTVQTRISADHLRWVFSTVDRDAVAGHSLSAGWLLFLELAKGIGLVDFGTLGGGTALFPTMAALSGWLSLATIVLLLIKWHGFHWSVLLLAISPWFAWSAVIPNGFALASVSLASMSFLATQKDGRLVIAGRRSWTWALNLLEGFAAGVTPAAWILVLTVSLLPSEETDRTKLKKDRWLRVGLIVLGLALHPALSLIVTSVWSAADSSVSWLPVLNSIRILGSEEPLGAALVFLGPVGETALGLLGSVSLVVAILISWFGARPLRAGLLVLPVILAFILGEPKAWRLAHPGWNSILEDVYLNVERSLDEPTIAITPAPTEEAIARYVTSFLAVTKGKERSLMVAVRPQSVAIDESLSKHQRILVGLPKYFEPKPGQMLPTVEDFFEKYLHPNLKNGIQFWFARPPLEAKGLMLRFMMTGVLVKSNSGPTQGRIQRSDAQRGYVRSRLHYREGVLKRAIEVQAYEPYATFHLAMADEFTRSKVPTDWERRALGELSAALRKAPWLKEPYQKVCVELENRPKTEVELKGNSQVTPVEPLDICLEIRAQM